MTWEHDGLTAVEREALIARPLDHALAEAERLAERQTAWMRLALGIIMTALLAWVLSFTLPPLPDEIEAMVRPRVALAVVSTSAWIGLAVISLVITGAAIYRPWMAWALALLDIILVGFAMLMVLVSSNLPGAYLAMVPGVWIVPLLMTVSGLRLDPTLVSFGLVGMVLSIALSAALYGVHPGPAGLDPRVELMFGLPPNLIRLTLLCLAGVVIVYTVDRNRWLVRQVIEEAQRRAALFRFLPNDVAERVMDGDRELVEGTRRAIVTMFIDIRGFTTYVEAADPADVARFLGAFRQRVGAAIEAEGGFVNSYAGDEVMGLFGAVGNQSGAPAHALMAAEEVLRTIRDWPREAGYEGPPGLAVGIGLHYGEAFCGAVGNDHRREFAVVGDTVNVAARLQGLCKDLKAEAVASEALMLAAGTAEDRAGNAWRRHGEVSVRGRSTPLPVWHRPMAQTSVLPDAVSAD